MLSILFRDIMSVSEREQAKHVHGERRMVNMNEIHDIIGARNDTEEKGDYLMRKCPYCGEELPEELHFCLYCMHELKTAQEEAACGHDRYRKKKAVVIAVLMIVGISGTVLGMMLHRNPQNRGSMIKAVQEEEQLLPTQEVVIGQKNEKPITERETDDGSSKVPILNLGSLTEAVVQPWNGTEDNKPPAEDEKPDSDVSDTEKPTEPDTEKPSVPDTGKPPEPDTEKPPAPDTEKPSVPDGGAGDSIYAPIELDWNAVIASAKQRVEAAVPITVIWAASEQDFHNSASNIGYANTMYLGIPDQGYIRTDGYDVPGVNDTYEDWFNYYVNEIVLYAKPHKGMWVWDESLGEEVYVQEYKWNPYVCFLEFQGLKEMTSLDCKYVAVIRIGI